MPISESTQGQPRAVVPHTQIHDFLRRTLETAQDIIVTALMVLLLLIMVQALWRLVQLVLQQDTPIATLLSQIMFVLILTELYRTLIHYLREHRISVALIVEIAIVSTLRELVLRGAHEFEEARVIASSVLLLVLGGLLAMERYFGQFESTSDTSAH
jgi:uncharacterized membrane protein (DUF373 family)